MKWSKFMVPAVLPFALVGCLDLAAVTDEENGDNNNNPPAASVNYDTDLGVGTVTYSGLTAAATLSSSDTEDLVYSLESVGLIDDVSSGFENAFDTLDTSSSAYVIKSLSGFVPKYEVDGNTLTGSCGGTLTFAEQTNKVTVTLDNFCDTTFFIDDVMEQAMEGLEVTVNGVIESTWTESDSEYSEQLVLNDFSMTAVDGPTTVIDIEVGGNVVFSEYYVGTEEHELSTYNLVMKDNKSNLQIKMEDLVEEYSYSGSYESMTEYMEINGRVYRSDLGYYDITTLETLVMTGSGDYPTDGKIEFKGANTVTMTFSDTAEPVVDVQ